MRVMLMAVLVALGCARPVVAEDATSYPKMAPVGQYLMDRGAEIALARSAAPDAIGRDAGVMVLGRHGFKTAVRSKNGFVCVVGRGWTSAADADFWNPKVRVPICVNAPAARSYLLRITKITALALAGRTPGEVNAAIAAGITAKELPPMESGAMCYMMSREGYGGDVAPHWPPHLMFFYSRVSPSMWGANTPGSPVIAVADPVEQLTQFVIPVGHWSDGAEYLPASPRAVHQ